MSETANSPVAVKPLEWRQLTTPREDGPAEPTGDVEATTMIGEYSVCVDEAAIADAGDDWKWCVWTSVQSLGHFADFDEAKAAAQTDYEQSIRSALVPTPGHDALITALKEAREYFAERADAEQPHGHDHAIGNAEMTLLVEIDAALAKAGAA